MKSLSKSQQMSCIRGEDTRPEMWLRKRLHALGYRFRLHEKRLPGKPDLVLPKYHAIILVNGCFWHMHQCRYFQFPRSSSIQNRGPEWWRSKLLGNRARDLAAQDKLRELGWRVLVLWECAIKGKERRPEAEAEVIQTVIQWLHSDIHYLEIPPVETVQKS
ncbi:very short patch repair endonuclease [Shewanella sp. 38A_GOM-205m]|uniref:very short patch repair endonuclease n=1 Tax=Shewanella sp. 38A_GOM-205m TaxID=1380363 RepID=UPI00048C2183|nr:very short patch repair endonuclease [Shewanella sp. 38A_GOM-205m]